MDAVAALRCLGLDEFAFEFRKAAQDGHISRPAVVVVSVHSPQGIGLTLWSVMVFRKQQQQISGGLCQVLLTTRVLPVFRKRLIWPVWPVRFCADGGLVDSTLAFRPLPRFNASAVTALTDNLTCHSNNELNLWAGMALSVKARVSSGFWIVAPIVEAAVAILWALGALARLLLNALLRQWKCFDGLSNRFALRWRRAIRLLCGLHGRLLCSGLLLPGLSALAFDKLLALNRENDFSRSGQPDRHTGARRHIFLR